MSAREAVGVLGGTFDPVHAGHLAMAERVRAALGLRRVLMVLTATPPHKQIDVLTALAHRRAMLEAALTGSTGLELSLFEAGAGVAYTVDTLRALRDADPGVDPVFVMGSDSLCDLADWRDAERLVTEFDLCVLGRAKGAGVTEAERELAPFVRDRLVTLDVEGGVARDLVTLSPGRGGRILLLPAEPVDVSSSAVRDTVRRGGDPAGLVPPQVAGYIQANGLYRSQDENGGSVLSNPISPALALCVEAAQDKKAEELIVLDLHGISDVTDHFVICHGSSDRQVQAIADGIEKRLRGELKERPANVEGRNGGQWVLMDYIDFVVHVFLAERREYYRLESLWGDAKRVDLDGLGTTSSAAG